MFGFSVRVVIWFTQEIKPKTFTSYRCAQGLSMIAFAWLAVLHALIHVQAQGTSCSFHSPDKPTNGCLHVLWAAVPGISMQVDISLPDCTEGVHTPCLTHCGPGRIQQPACSLSYDLVWADHALES
jgi:hypothetical protein